MLHTNHFWSRHGLQTRADAQAHAQAHPHLGMPAGWGSWREHYLQSSAFFAGNEECQCWRPEGLAFFEEHVENRFFYFPESNVSVSYIQVFGRLPVHGYLPVSAAGAHVLRPELYGTSEEAAATSGRAVEWDWEGDVAEVLEHVLGDNYADVLVFNSGLWGPLHDRGYVRRFLKAGARAVCPSDQRERGGAQGLCLWRTTTRRFVCDDGKKFRGGEGPRWEKYDRACPRREWVPEDVRDDMVLEEIAAGSGGGEWEIIDVATGELGQDAFTDHVHPMPFVYEEMIHALLHRICPLP